MDTFPFSGKSIVPFVMCRGANELILSTLKKKKIKDDKWEVLR